VSGLMLTYLGQTPRKHEPIDLSKTCRQSLSLLQTVLPNKVTLATEGKRLCLPKSGGHGLRDHEHGYREALRSVFHHQVHRPGPGVVRGDRDCPGARRGRDGRKRTEPGQCFSGLFADID
ncbi:MAG: hypothetical protein WCR46_26460, partial [Deltaproteobacteria bacterium]